MTGERTRRKKDFVSIMAVLMFSITVLFELYIIYLIPSLLKKEQHWERDVIVEELIELQDMLRANLTDASNKHKIIEDEVGLAKSCLDSYARYLRENKDFLSTEQAENILSVLLEFQRIHQKYWYKDRTSICSDRKIDISNFIKLQEKKLQ